MKHFTNNTVTGIFLLLTPFILCAQDHQLAVTKSVHAYEKQVKDDSTKQMVELKELIPGLVYDLRYASSHNFVHRPLYPSKTNVAFLRLPVVRALQKVQEELNEQRLGLKIFDAYRPYSVTKKFWNLIKDERYVANPSKGSGHNRGIAVDLTLVRLKNGEEIDMGTGFDSFSDTAHIDYTRLPREVRDHRQLLRSIMEKYGFKPLETEWWHYSFVGGEKFELLDIEFKKLKNQNSIAIGF